MYKNLLIVAKVFKAENIYAVTKDLCSVLLKCNCKCTP